MRGNEQSKPYIPRGFILSRPGNAETLPGNIMTAHAAPYEEHKNATFVNWQACQTKRWIVLSGSYDEEAPAAADTQHLVALRNRDRGTHLRGVKKDVACVAQFNPEHTTTLSNKEVTKAEAVDFLALMLRMNRDKPAALCYSGHGCPGSGALAFRVESAAKRDRSDFTISPAELVSVILQQYGKPLDLIVLDSCYSGNFLAEVIRLGGCTHGISSSGDNVSTDSDDGGQFTSWATLYWHQTQTHRRGGVMRYVHLPQGPRQFWRYGEDPRVA